jgi:hypothetical protein
VDSAKASGLQPSVHVRRLVLGVLSEVTDETLGLPADKVAAYLPDQIIGHVVVKWLR